MHSLQRNFRKSATIVVAVACCLMALLWPGWRNHLRAIDYVSLANCALPNALRLTARLGDAPSQHSIYVGNNLIPGCEINIPEEFSASITYLNGENWLGVAPATGTLQQGQRNSVRVTFTPAALPGPGTYQGFVHIRVPSISGTISIPVAASLLAPSPQLALSWAAVVFQAVERTGAPPEQIVNLSNTGTGTLNWEVDAAGLPSWLTISPLSGTADASNPYGYPLSVKANTANLNASVYTALVPFRSGTATNSPQYLSVTYHVVTAAAPPVPVLTAYGLVFRAAAGTTANLTQPFNFSNAGGGAVAGQFTATTASGNWLSVAPASASATSGSPVTLQASVNPVGLQPGTYRGTITAAFLGRTQTVDVLLIVTPVGTNPPGITRAALAGCTPTSMALVGTSVGNGSTSPVSFPQALLAQVLDSCGDPVSNATVVATAAGVSIPMANSGGGFYSGTWTPTQTAASNTVNFVAFHPAFESVQQTFAVASAAATGGTLLPVLFIDGVVDGAGFAPRRPLVPGEIVSLFGSSLAPTTAAATRIPLERELAQTSVRIGGIAAPLYFVSAGQINAQIPFEARPGDTASIVVSSGGRLTTPQNYPIAATQPGIFVSSAGPAVLDDQFRPITAENPARHDRVIQIFCGGLGITNPPAASGDALPGASDAAIPVAVNIGGLEASVQYQGLAPGFVGLYQVNVIVPSGVQPGSAVPLVIRQDGIPSNPTQNITIPVQP